MGFLFGTGDLSVPSVKQASPRAAFERTANLRTKILDLTWFDSNSIFILRGGIIMSMGDFPEILSRGILVGIILVWRLSVPVGAKGSPPSSGPARSSRIVSH